MKKMIADLENEKRLLSQKLERAETDCEAATLDMEHLKSIREVSSEMKTQHDAIQAKCNKLDEELNQKWVLKYND